MSNKINLETPILFEWVAVTTKDEEIQQFSANGEETLFKTVLELSERKELSLLYLIPKRPEYRKSVMFAVNFQTGLHLVKGIPLNLIPLEIRDETELHFRPIHVRRMRREFGAGGKPIKKEPYLHRYLLGWQVTVNGKNYQRIIAIDPMTAGISEIMEKR